MRIQSCEFAHPRSIGFGTLYPISYLPTNSKERMVVVLRRRRRGGAWYVGRVEAKTSTDQPASLDARLKRKYAIGLLTAPIN